MATSSSTWKAFEREVARFFGCERTPLSGMCHSLTKADTLHLDLFIECKLRSNFRIFTRFREIKTALKKQKVDLPLVIRLTNGRKYQKGDVWLFDYCDIEKVAQSAIVGYADDGSVKLTYLMRNIALDKTEKADTILTLYKEVEEKSLKEEKVPVVAIKMKNRKGWLVAVAPIYLSKVSQIIQENTLN